MKLKRLFFVLLTFFAPAIWAMDELPHQNTEFKQKGINANDICLVCHALAENVPQNERCITNCCNEFICAQDAQSIFKAAGESQYEEHNIRYKLGSTGLRLTAEQIDQMYEIVKNPNKPKNTKCPRCSIPLSISATHLKKSLKSKPVLTCIDAEDIRFDLSPELSAALLECESFKMHEDTLSTPAPFDFSNVNPEQKRFLKKSLIIKLAQLIKDPVKETQHIVRNLEFFELAKYLAAPDNVLYLAANELWPLMQDTIDDTPQVKEYKKHIKQLAKPHLATPKNLAKYRKARLFSTKLASLNTSSFIPYDSSISAVSNLANGGWYQDKQHNWYKVYPFCTLDGIKYIYGGTTPSSLDVSGHRLEAIPASLLQEMSMDEYTNIFINFNNNPIASIDRSFFQILAKKRAKGIGIIVSLMETALTTEQKEEIIKRFHHATTTLTQRYPKCYSTLKYLAIGAGCIGAPLAVRYLSDKLPALINGTSVVSSAVMAGSVGGFLGEIINAIADRHHGHSIVPMILGAGAGAILGGAMACESIEKDDPVIIPSALLATLLGGFGASILVDYAALGLAKRSHPDISWKANNDIVWKTNYQLNI